MSAATKVRYASLLDALSASFAEALRVPEGTQEPVALLWTDAEGQWRDLVPKLQAAMPELFALGAYNPALRIGPVVWLRCVVDRSLPEVVPPIGRTPILYLGGVGRQSLRAAGECPRELQPLVELQYRGRVWHQKNGRDWSVEAFLSAEEALALDLAQDARTREAMMRALPLLAETPIESLRGHRLEAEDFDRLAVSDPIRDLLRWMSDSEALREGMDTARWESFCSVSRSEFQVDPDDGPSTAASALAAGAGRWDDVWRRFAEAPRLYPGLPNLLRTHAKGQKSLLVDRSRDPSANEAEEQSLREALQVAVSRPHRDACEAVCALHRAHGERRQWVWAQLGLSPLAVALEPLARLASSALSPLGGTTVEAMSAVYVDAGWRADEALTDALALPLPPADSAIVHKAVAALYGPWCDASARQFQRLVSEAKGPGPLPAEAPPQKGTCILFADGLRLEAGRRLERVLLARGLRVRFSHRLAPLPTVTATAKPVVMPLADVLTGESGADGFAPTLAATAQPAIITRLRGQMAAAGVEVMEDDALPPPTSAEAVGWAEVGRLDELGHKLGAGLAQHMERSVETIADRIAEALSAGWRRVRVVTDHGWLLLPGGLPKVDLPAHLVETKWSRCAAVRGGSVASVPVYPWHWNPLTQIASPPGIGSFKASVEYSHGGVSLQECVVPEILVEAGATAAKAAIADIQWRGMRCRIRTSATAGDIQADLRTNWRQPASSIAASVKEVGPGGEVSLAVADDTHEGAAATLVLLDAAGNVLDRRATTVGEAL